MLASRVILILCFLIAATFFVAGLISARTGNADMSSAPSRLAASSFAPMDLDRAEKVFRSKGYVIPRRVEESDFEAITDPETAKLILEAGRNVYRYYHFENGPPRFSVPENMAEVFSAPTTGSCDAAARVIGQLLDGRAVVKNLNFLFPYFQSADPAVDGKNYKLRGHTVAYVKLQHGAVAIGPTYGIMLLTTAPDLNTEVIRSGNYEIFMLSDDIATSVDGLTPVRGLELFSLLADGVGDAAVSGERLTAVFPRIRIPVAEPIRIGKLDGSSLDMTRAFGGWADHIGYWYEQVRHRWRVEPLQPGLQEAKFHLLDGENAVLKAPLDVKVDIHRGMLISRTWTPSRQFPNTLTVRFVTWGPASINLTSNGVSGRKLDAIELRHISFSRWLRELFAPFDS